MLLSIVYISHPNQIKGVSQNVEEYTFYPPPPPPPKNRDKSKNLRSVKTALCASTLAALGLLIALAVLLPNAAAEAQSSPASTATATATTAPTTTDYDADNDGLIDIKTLAQLNAVRYDLNGDGDSTHADYIAAFPNRDTTAAGRMGCPSGTCSGYELMEDDLDFDADGNGIVEDTELYSNWTPIGTATSASTRFNATFKSNSADAIATISNLTIKDSSKEVGLFGATGPNARIEGIGLVDVYVKPSAALPRDAKIGALVGDNDDGTIIACYSTGAIDATAGSGSYAGGLVGYNTGTIDAGFSRATVDLEMEAGAIGGSTNIYAGGLAGHNEGTLTATYAAGAVKGKGGSDSYVGGLVGYNITPSDATSATKTIVASYSIAPVTSVAYATTVNPPPTPTVGGLTGYNDSSARITASYWDYIASGVPDDSDTDMPEGKSTHALISPTGVPTSATGTYAGWNKLSIDGVSNVTPWKFSLASTPRQHPWLTYGGHTRAADLSGNQCIAPSNIKDNSGGRNTGHPREGMSLESSLGISSSLRLRGGSGGGWTWQGSTDGITWTTLSLGGDAASRAVSRGAAGSFRFVPRQEHINKYIRAKRQLTTGDFVYTRVMGKIKPAATAAAALGFASGDNPPRVGTEITVAALPSGATDARGLWYRCDTNTSTSSGCDLVGSLRSYIPGAADLNHYIRADIYYNKDNTWTRSSTGFTIEKVADRFNQWRAN